MSLSDHVESFEIQAPSTEFIAGLPIDLVAVPSKILNVSDVEVVTGAVDLNVVFKHVQLETEDGLTPWPPPAAVTDVVASLTSGLAAAPTDDTIEGWLASISGTVPVGMRDISGQISIDFDWVFTDLDNPSEPRGDVLFNPDNPGPPLADVTVIGGALDASAVTIVLPPAVTGMVGLDFDEALTDAPVARWIGVQCRVRGRIGTTEDVEFLAPPAPLVLEITPLPLPSVGALFRNKELGGDAVLVMVPEDSPFSGAAALVPVLSALKNVVDKIDTAATLTAWATGTSGLKSAVDGLINGLAQTTHVGFKARDSYKNLKDYKFIPKPWHTPDYSMHERGSSALVLSASRELHLYNLTGPSGKLLALEPIPLSSTRIGGVVVRNLHVAVPSSEPPGCASITGTPKGGHWGNTIESYEWGD